MGQREARMRQPPYLPFLNGPPGLSPGLSPIPVSKWLSPDTEAESWLSSKRNLMRSHRSEVYGDIADADRWTELLDVFHQDGLSLHRGEWDTPLERAAASVSDDLCMMVRGGDGLWTLEAASLCAPTFWRLSEKLGKPLGGLHTEVPGADPTLERRISRMFDALREGLVLERFNWTVQAGDTRFAPDSAPLKAMARDTRDEDALDVLHLRVERQTIRKLTNPDAILFTIRSAVDPLRAALFDGTHIKAFADAWAGIDPDLAVYKGWPHYERLVRAALKTLSRQGAKG